MNSDSDSFNDIISKILLVNTEDVEQGFTMKDNEEWDSMTHLVLISEMENSYSIVFSDEEVIEMNSIEKIKSTLKKHSINVD